jgi:sporulation protein YunB
MIFGRFAEINMKLKKKFKIFFVLFILTAFSVIILYGMEKNLMPVLIDISSIKAKKVADSAIDSAVRSSLTDLNIKSADFFTTDKKTDTVATNTVLINNFCSHVSSVIDAELAEEVHQAISVPIGAATGSDFLSLYGPRVRFTLINFGDSIVDYETSFESAGINMLNYKVWLNIETYMELVNPLRSKYITTTRKVMIIDTVIKGNIPNTYFKVDR